jgi:tetratricopeptide (TPR) repeat protein
MAKDWYRKTTWSEADQEDFEARWKRARGDWNRFQYLTIQAAHLVGAKPPRYSEALRLIDRALSDFHEPIGIANALALKARCIHALSGFDAAIPVYREALQYEKADPRVRTQMWSLFPWLIAKERKIDLYDEALEWLSFPQSKDVMFPIDRLRSFTVLAIVADHYGDHVKARSDAESALRAAVTSRSPFPRHREIGLVTQIEPWAKAALDRILAA